MTKFTPPEPQTELERRAFTILCGAKVETDEDMLALAHALDRMAVEYEAELEAENDSRQDLHTGREDINPDL